MSKEREEALKALSWFHETCAGSDRKALAAFKKVKKYIDILEKKNG